MKSFHLVAVFQEIDSSTDSLNTSLVLPSCDTCIYANNRGGCWARKGRAVYGAIGCDYRRQN